MSHEIATLLVVAAALSSLALFGWVAYGAIHWLSTRTPEDYRLRIPGPKPTALPNIDNQLKKSQDFKWRELAKTGAVIVSLFVSGITAPTGLFVAAIKNYAWFMPDDHPFVRQGTPIQNLTTTELTTFTASQLGSGALLDTVEVFDRKLSPITYRVGDKPIELLILAYRSFIELFTGAFLLSLLTFARAMFSQTSKEKELHARRTIGFWSFRNRS